MSETPHVDYPHQPGYLDSCPGCADGPCVCGDPCSDPGCLSGEFGYSHAPGYRFGHNGPCWSDHCEHPDNNVDDPDYSPATGEKYIIDYADAAEQYGFKP